MTEAQAAQLHSTKCWKVLKEILSVACEISLKMAFLKSIAFLVWILESCSRYWCQAQFETYFKFYSDQWSTPSSSSCEDISWLGVWATWCMGYSFCERCLEMDDWKGYVGKSTKSWICSFEWWRKFQAICIWAQWSRCQCHLQASLAIFAILCDLSVALD